MTLGTVKWFNDAKGFGFIKQDNKPDVFVHYSQIAGGGYRTLDDEQLVQFDLHEGPKGLFAENVTKIGVKKRSDASKATPKNGRHTHSEYGHREDSTDSIDTHTT